jgi:hypothetical protein
MAAKPESKEATKQIVCEHAIIESPQMSSWNDNRLDELSARIDQRFEMVDRQFEKVDQRFEKVEGEMKAGFEKVEGEMKAGFTRVDDQLHRLSHILITGGLVVIATLLGVIGSIVATGFLG